MKVKAKQEKKGLPQGKAIHSFIPLLFMVILCTIISCFVIPGAYDRETVDGVTRVIADSYHTVEAPPSPSLTCSAPSPKDLPPPQT